MASYLHDLVTDYYFWGAIGFGVGSVLVVHNLLKSGVSFPFAVIVWTLTVYAGLVGSRILMILETVPGLFRLNPLLALAFWQGGLAWQGGVMLGIPAMLVMFRICGKPAWANVGGCTPGLALSHAIARMGCVFQGCCYGAPTTVPWAIYSAVLGTRVHPTQGYSMVCELTAAAVLQLLWLRPGTRRYLAPLYCLLLGMHRLVTEAFRGTPPGPEIIPGLRFYQSTSVMLIVVSVIVLVILWRVFPESRAEDTEMPAEE